MPDALRIGLLGPLQVRDGAGCTVHVGGRQLRVLLILLALAAGRVAPSGWLAEQIWPGEPPGHPGNALQTLVSRLRAELRRAGLDDIIESHSAGYRLAVPPDAVDTVAFEALAVQGRRALADGDPDQAARVLRTALLLWRGQPLADAAGYEFADVAAARLTELRASVAADRIEADLALGEGARLVGELRALLSADPLAERPRALLMRALYAAGRQAEALETYQEARELLADQLGVDPSAQLEQVYLRILRGEEGLAAGTHSPVRPSDPSFYPERPPVQPSGTSAHPRVRRPLTSFVGRDTEVSQVLKNLSTTRLVTLTGPGGVGKTRLAAEVSGRLPEAAWFVELAPVNDPAEVAYTVLDTLGIRGPVIARRTGEPGAAPLDRLAAALADRADVMVLDNCEHVIEAAAALADRVLAACPRMRILATSRQPLRIDGETLCPVLLVTAGESPDLPAPRYRMLETVRAYGLERLAEAGEQDRLRDAFATRHLNLAETADPQLRAAGQRRWLRELTAEQDNLHMALRWAIARQDADTALRLVRALGWYWLLRGQPGDPEALAGQVLEMQPRERSAVLAEARVVCAITAAGPSWDIETVRPALVAAVSDFAELSHGEPPSNPIAAMGEPMLAIYDRDLDRAFAAFDQYLTSPDPWIRAAVPLLRATFGKMVGRMDWAESGCRESLAAFRALGEAWGAASVLMQLAELAQLKADYATAVAALEEAKSFGRQLGAWGDLSYIDGMLAAIRLRTGELDRARADLEQAEHAESERSVSKTDSGAWLALVRAELYWREGDMAAAVRCCMRELAWLEEKPSPWWNGMRALLQTRLARLVFEDGEEARCRVLLATALRTAADWVERPVLAGVIDAIAVLTLRDDAALTAALLGAAHNVRGAFDEGSLDAPPARDAVRGVLGATGFEAAYERGRALSRDAAVALAFAAVTDRANA